MGWISWFWRVLVMGCGLGSLDPIRLAAQPADGGTWKSYKTSRFEFSVRSPSDWRLGHPMPDGTWITLS